MADISICTGLWHRARTVLGTVTGRDNGPDGKLPASEGRADKAGDLDEALSGEGHRAVYGTCGTG